MKLFFSPTSPYVRKCLVVAHELGLTSRIEFLASNAHPVTRDQTIIANNPLYKGGAIDADACQKVQAFFVLCDSFNIPIVMLVDQPGFLIGMEGEQKGVTGKVMNWLNAMTLVTVPKISVIVRKSYGLAVSNMGAGGNTDELACWLTAEISFMKPDFGAKVVFGVDPLA